MCHAFMHNARCAPPWPCLTACSAGSSAWDPLHQVRQLTGALGAGEAAGRLELLEPIGTGGYGSVYRGGASGACWHNV